MPEDRVRQLVDEYVERDVKRRGLRSRSVFENEMPVEQHGFHFCQEVVFAIQITPARLYDADLRIGKIVDGLL